MMARFLALVLAAFLMSGATAAAQGNRTLTSTIELEKLVSAGEGKDPIATYSAPDVVVPGDRVRVTLVFTNSGVNAATGINVTNPITEGLIFDGTGNPEAFTVSVDGGKSFGSLARAMIAVDGAAPRAATIGDVTHVRWLWLDAIAPGQSRSVAFFARVK